MWHYYACWSSFLFVNNKGSTLFHDDLCKISSMLILQNTFPSLVNGRQCEQGTHTCTHARVRTRAPLRPNLHQITIIWTSGEFWHQQTFHSVPMYTSVTMCWNGMYDMALVAILLTIWPVKCLAVPFLLKMWSKSVWICEWKKNARGNMYSSRCNYLAEYSTHN